jgi:hypothetical protein
MITEAGSFNILNFKTDGLRQRAKNNGFATDYRCMTASGHHCPKMARLPI